MSERKKTRGQARIMREKMRERSPKHGHITRRRRVSQQKESSSLSQREANAEKGVHCYGGTGDSSTDKPHIWEEDEDEEVQREHSDAI